MTGHRTPLVGNARTLAAYRLLRSVAESPDPWLRHPAAEADVIREAVELLRGKPRRTPPW